MKEASEGVQLLYNLVSKFHNDAPLSVVYPELIFSIDDTVHYIFEGDSEKQETCNIVGLKSNSQAGTRTKYKIST